jgi:C-terminal peptidase prc
MHSNRPLMLVLSILVAVGISCGASQVSEPTLGPLTASSATPADTPWPPTNEFGVRYCRYDPAAPATALALRPPADAPTPYPSPTPPPAGGGDPAATEHQLGIFRGLWNAVNDHYVDRAFNGLDWEAVGARYREIVEGGLSDEAFYALMQAMINELGDGHSYFQSPADIEEEVRALSGRLEFVGIGMLARNTPDGGAVVILTFPDGPAAEAGLLAHDTILAVDGGPPRDESGVSRTLGPEGTTTTLTVQAPGEAPRDLTIERRQVTGALPVDSCIVPGTRLGYVMIPSLLDETIDDQLRQSLSAMTADGLLDGLILDNRMNGGGSGAVAEAVLGMFVSGPQGTFVSREARNELVIEAEDIGGSQSVPLVVLIGPDTVSYGEVVSGILQSAGRALIVGQPTLGNVEQLRRYDLDDGSRAWIASATFEPIGMPAGIWEDSGIVPDVVVAGDWDEFSEANDPGLAAAAGLLLTR